MTKENEEEREEEREEKEKKEREEKIQKALEEIREAMKYESPFPKDFLKDLRKQLRIELPKIELPKIEFPKIEFPKIEFPKIEFPKIELQDIELKKLETINLEEAYKKIKKITDDNSKFGWTLTNEMLFISYYQIDLTISNKKEKDEHFLTYYSKNNLENFLSMESEILNNIEDRWLEIIQECFDSYRNNKYKLIIPTLFTIIEGEIAFFLDEEKVKKGQIDKLKEHAENQKDRSKRIVIYSLHDSINHKNALFKNIDGFYLPRDELINRHRVLHGNDEPKLWEKVDALRLFNVISTIQYVKAILKEMP